jgi:hypothetical protein
MPNPPQGFDPLYARAGFGPSALCQAWALVPPRLVVQGDLGGGPPVA